VRLRPVLESAISRGSEALPRAILSEVAIPLQNQLAMPDLNKAFLENSKNVIPLRRSPTQNKYFLFEEIFMSNTGTTGRIPLFLIGLVVGLAALGLLTILFYGSYVGLGSSL
jgi:hypothetical protein